MSIFDPHKIHTPIDRSPKILLLMITCQIWCKSVHGWLLGEWVKYNENFYLFIYLYVFSGTHLKLRPVDGFSRLMAQTTRTSARVCFLEVSSLILLPIFGAKLPPKTILGREYTFPSQTWTRSSAIAEGPRDASCQLKSCQLPRNSAETILVRQVLNKSKLRSWRVTVGQLDDAVAS